MKKKEGKLIIIRDWNRLDYLELLYKGQLKKGVEVGVFNGEFSEYLIRNLPTLELYLVDCWKEFPKEDYDDCANLSQKVYSARYKLVKSLFEEKENVSIIRKTSMEAVKQFEDESLDFVYIDANHAYNYVKQDIQEWSKKVRIGGIISGHDYDMVHPDVVKAVNESFFASEDYIEPLIIYRMASIWTYRKEKK